MNNNLILVSGKTGTGKSMCLRNIKNQERWIYLNCENNKALPFKNNFKSFNITDPLHVYEAFDYMAANETKFDGIVIDTLTFLMDMYVTTYVDTAADSRAAWGDYKSFWKRLMQQYVAKTNKKVAFLAHTSDVLNEGEQVVETVVKVQGSLMAQGIEAYFSNVVSTKKIPLTKLEKLKQKSSYLTITPREERVGFKHCFQTDVTKDSVNERMRTPLDMWKEEETYIDNDLDAVFNRIEEYYK